MFSKVNQNETLYPEWQRHSREKNNLYLKAVHKALDLPEDEEMNVTTGMSGKAVALIAAAAGLGPAAALFALLPALMGDRNEKPAAPEKPVPVVGSADPADSEYEIRFYDSDGNLINVPQKSGEESQ